MKIVTNDNGVITAILYMGDAEGAVEVTGDVPDDLDVFRYKYADGQFVRNTDPMPDPDPVPDISFADRLSATEDAVAEIIEMLMGGDSDG